MNQEIEIGVETLRQPAKSDPATLSSLNTLEQGLLATYDFTKHTSMLSLVAMGGMLALVQGSGQPLSKNVMLSIAIVGLAGFLSMAFMASAAATQIAQRAHKTSKWLALGMVYVILALFTAGVTIFFRAVSHSIGS
jgi:hypothetical protein